MKSMVAIAGLLLLAVPAWTADDRPVRKGFVVHEWGVFRVNTDAAFANAELRAEWDDLPAFVYGTIKGRAVPHHWGAVEIRRKPILFFHATEPLEVRIKIDFPGGQAGVWYPATEKPAVYAMEKQPKNATSLEWKLGIKTCPKGWRPKNQDLPAVAENHWIHRIRQVKTDDVYSLYSPNLADVEHDKFLYYDGIFPQGKWLKIDVNSDNVSLTSQVKHPLYDVTVVDRRGDKVRVGRIAKLNASQTIQQVGFVEVDASRFSSEASGTLLKQLTAAGLYQDEAQSLIDLWRKELFDSPGLNLFYRLPQQEYDARLPLAMAPNPESTIRVGLVYHAHLEPDFADKILELVKQLDSPRFVVRDATLKKIVAIGPAALVQLQRIRERNDLSVEVRERIDLLVKKWFAKDGFDQ